MNEWHPISELPPELSLLLVFCNHDVRKYAFCTSGELEELKKEYPDASHWKMYALPPSQ